MKRYFSSGICLLFLILMAPQVFGETISFGDKTTYWTGWQSISSDPNRDNYRNTHDFLGTPDINPLNSGGSATVNDNGYLTNVTFSVLSKNGGSWSLLKPADLFIDTDNNKTWDFVVNMIAPTGPGDQGLYAISQPLGDTDYDTAYIQDRPELTISTRANHPIGVTGGEFIGSTGFVNFSGWPGSLATGSSTQVSFDFLTQSILLGSNFAIGWTVNCANDVIYEELNHQVPEPATLLLLGSGLIGLAGVGRKRLFSKKIG